MDSSKPFSIQSSSHAFPEDGYGPGVGLEDLPSETPAELPDFEKGIVSHQDTVQTCVGGGRPS